MFLQSSSHRYEQAQDLTFCVNPWNPSLMLAEPLLGSALQPETQNKVTFRLSTCCGKNCKDEKHNIQKHTHIIANLHVCANKFFQTGSEGLHLKRYNIVGDVQRLE